MSNFFSAIYTYAQQANLTLMINAVEGGKLSVIFTTKAKNGNTDPALNATQRFTGTPEELDEQLIPALPELGNGYKSLAETIAAVKTIQDSAKQTVVAKAAATKQEGSKPAPAASTHVPAASAPVPASNGPVAAGDEPAEEENLFGGV